MSNMTETDEEFLKRIASFPMFPDLERVIILAHCFLTAEARIRELTIENSILHKRIELLTDRENMK